MKNISRDLALNIFLAKLAHTCRTYNIPENLSEHYAWELLQAACKCSRTALLRAGKISLDTQQQIWLQAALDRLSQHEPLQYILGSVDFLSLTLAVRPPILIPRSETESWVATCIEQYQTTGTAPLRILDLCTGSGCIALAFAQTFPQSKVVGIDIEPEAIALARDNAIKNNLANVTFLVGDLYEPLPTTEQFDLIVTNPPYVASDLWQKLDLSVQNWEDKKAIIAEHEGLALIERIVAAAPLYLSKSLSKHKPSSLWIEMDIDQNQKITDLLLSSGADKITLHKDNLDCIRTISALYFPK